METGGFTNNFDKLFSKYNVLHNMGTQMWQKYSLNMERISLREIPHYLMQVCLSRCMAEPHTNPYGLLINEACVTRNVQNLIRTNNLIGPI